MHSVSNPLRIPTIGVQWRCAYVCGSSSRRHISYTPAPEPHSSPPCSLFLRLKITYRSAQILFSQSAADACTMSPKLLSRDVENTPGCSSGWLQAAPISLLYIGFICVGSSQKLNQVSKPLCLFKSSPQDIHSCWGSCLVIDLFYCWVTHPSEDPIRRISTL